MSSDVEPAKLLLPFLQRADELQKHEPLVAYYCRLYAMERGLKIPQKERTKTTNSLLISLMNQLEKDKKSLKLGPEDNLYIEGFASSVFAKADKQDRAGRADLNTAKTFYAASIFFEVLTQFGELAPDIEQKLKYAVWKAADIRKALKEGRNPEPGPPGGDKDLFGPSIPQTNTKFLESSGSFQSKISSMPPSDQMAQDFGGESISKSEAISPSQPPHQDLARSGSYAGGNISIHPANPHVTQYASNPPSSYSTHDYSSTDYPQSPQPFPQNYQHSYSFEPPPFAQNYTHENPTTPYSFPNFQSYPSFQESSFPAAPTHPPLHFQESTATPSISTYKPTPQHGSPSSNGNHAGSLVLPAASFKYDSNYQPPVEKITEAHKAAKFAVGALAFDDVPVAVEFLRRSLELLTNPSAEPH